MNSLEKDQQNRVLVEGALRPENLFVADRILSHLYSKSFSASTRDWMSPRWQELGRALGAEMDQLSQSADRQGPVLRDRDLYGQDRQEVIFHPAYEQLTRMAVASGMFALKWDPGLKEKFKGQTHQLGFSAGLLYAMGEAGLYCPLCMTDGAARIIDRYASPADRERILPHIYTWKAEELYTGAMFLTEKSGGSDVGANRVMALKAEPGSLPENTPEPEFWYRLYGEKWFCSNATAEIALVLARTEGAEPGTRGLSIFLLEQQGPGGLANPRHYIRLKDKLGVRSMASAEIEFQGTWAKRLGQEGQGFAIMTEMINLSRLYNAVTAVALTRRALHEAWFFLSNRTSFGRSALEHPLVAERLERLCAGWQAELYLCWRAIQALDAADQGDEQEARLLRLLTPMVKRSSAEFAVYAIREAMELMGGLGYIEQGIMPKLFRDAQVLPIWEGAGNIMLLDMLRAMDKAGAAIVLKQELERLFSKLPDPGAEDWAQALWPAAEEWSRRSVVIFARIEELTRMERPMAEYHSRPALEALTELVQAALLIHQYSSDSADWIAPALSQLARRIFGEWSIGVRDKTGPLSPEKLARLMGLDGSISA